jgi:hypothetical protein
MDANPTRDRSQGTNVNSRFSSSLPRETKHITWSLQISIVRYVRKAVIKHGGNYKHVGQHVVLREDYIEIKVNSIIA